MLDNEMGPQPVMQPMMGPSPPPTIQQTHPMYGFQGSYAGPSPPPPSHLHHQMQVQQQQAPPPPPQAQISHHHEPPMLLSMDGGGSGTPNQAQQSPMQPQQQQPPSQQAQGPFQVQSEQQPPPQQQQPPPQQQQHAMVHCVECRAPIYPHETKISCQAGGAGCKNYYHRHCSGLTELACQMLLSEEPAAEWVCNRCICGNRRIPFVRMHSQQNDCRQSAVW